MKVGIKLGKVKKFGIGWCIPHRVEVLEAVNAVCVGVGGVKKVGPKKFGIGWSILHRTAADNAKRVSSSNRVKRIYF